MNALDQLYDWRGDLLIIKSILQRRGMDTTSLDHQIVEVTDMIKRQVALELVASVPTAFGTPIS